MLPELAERLLNAEASACGLPSPVIHVAKNIHAADGGEDARITWKGGPSETRFLPSRACQFQLKSGRIGPAAAGKEVLKDMVGPFVQRGGNYITLCTHPYDQKAIRGRENSARQALREAGLTISDYQVQFRSAEQIANWANHHPAVAVWLKEKIQAGTVGPFRSWVHWSGDAEHDSFPWVGRPTPARTETTVASADRSTARCGKSRGSCRRRQDQARDGGPGAGCRRGTKRI